MTKPKLRLIGSGVASRVNGSGPSRRYNLVEQVLTQQATQP